MSNEQPDLGFIYEKTLRESITSDLIELQKCLDNEAWKSCYLLAGSIIEAVLADSIIASGESKSSTLKMTLGQLIDKAHSLQQISDRAKNLSTVLQDYRNLIHPGRSVRLDETPDREGATTGSMLVQIVIRHVGKYRFDAYGYTSIQVLDKLSNDPRNTVAIGHLLANMSSIELNKLLTTDLPQRALDTEVDNSPGYFLIRSGLRNCFSVSYSAAKVDSRKSSVKVYSNLIREGTELQISRFEKFLWTCRYLQDSEESDKELILDHLIAKFKDRAHTLDLFCLSGILKFLDKRRMQQLFNACPDAIDSLYYNEGDISDISSFMTSEISSYFSSEIDAAKIWGECIRYVPKQSIAFKVLADVSTEYDPFADE